MVSALAAFYMVIGVLTPLAPTPVAYFLMPGSYQTEEACKAAVGDIIPLYGPHAQPQSDCLNGEELRTFLHRLVPGMPLPNGIPAEGERGA